MVFGRRRGRPAGVDRSVLTQDHAVQLLQLPARLDPELFVQGAAAVVVGLQRLGLAAAAVERQHQEPPHAVAQRMLSTESLELRNELVVGT